MFFREINGDCILRLNWNYRKFVTKNPCEIGSMVISKQMSTIQTDLCFFWEGGGEGCKIRLFIFSLWLFKLEDVY